MLHAGSDTPDCGKSMGDGLHGLRNTTALSARDWRDAPDGRAYGQFVAVDFDGGFGDAGVDSGGDLEGAFIFGGDGGFVTLSERRVVGTAYRPIRGGGQLVAVGIKQRESPGLAD